jgi:hypothetical protein
LQSLIPGIAAGFVATKRKEDVIDAATEEHQQADRVAGDFDAIKLTSDQWW